MSEHYILGVPNVRVLECNQHNQGNIDTIFTSYVDDVMTSSFTPTIVLVDANSYGIAFGYKLSADLAAFLLFDYGRFFKAKELNGTWTVTEI